MEWSPNLIVRHGFLNQRGTDTGLWNSPHKLGDCDSPGMLDGVMLYVLGRIAFCAFAQRGWGGCKESKTKQVSLFEKRMFIEVGFNLGAIPGEELQWYLSITLAWTWCCVASLTSVRLLWMCCRLLQPRSDVGHGCGCVYRLYYTVYIRSICKLQSSASITPMIWNTTRL